MIRRTVIAGMSREIAMRNLLSQVDSDQARALIEQDAAECPDGWPVVLTPIDDETGVQVGLHRVIFEERRQR